MDTISASGCLSASSDRVVSENSYSSGPQRALLQAFASSPVECIVLSVLLTCRLLAECVKKLNYLLSSAEVWSAEVQ